MPYQLHCCAVALQLLVTELLLKLDLLELTTLLEETLNELLLELNTELEAELNLLDELDTTEDELEREEAEEAAPHTFPVTTGVSAVPLVSTCIPKDTVWPGCTLPFQLKLVAE